MIEVFDFIDLNFFVTLAILVFAIVLIKVVFRVITKNRVAKTLVIGAIVLLVFVGIYAYNKAYQNVYYKASNSYIYGRVTMISNTNNMIQINSTKSNFSSGGTGKLVASYDSKTLIISEKDKDKKLSERDIKIGDTVQILCVEHRLEEGQKQVTALRIIKKN